MGEGSQRRAKTHQLRRIFIRGWFMVLRDSSDESVYSCLLTVDERCTGTDDLWYMYCTGVSLRGSSVSSLFRVPVCARVSRVCPGSPRCLFTGAVSFRHRTDRGATPGRTGYTATLFEPAKAERSPPPPAGPAWERPFLSSPSATVRCCQSPCCCS